MRLLNTDSYHWIYNFYILNFRKPWTRTTTIYSNSSSSATPQSENPASSSGSQTTSSAKGNSSPDLVFFQPSVLISRLELSIPAEAPSNCKSGTLPDKKDSKLSPLRTTKEPTELSLYMTSPTGNLSRTLKIGLLKLTNTAMRTLWSFWLETNLISRQADKSRPKKAKHWLILWG